MRTLRTIEDLKLYLRDGFPFTQIQKKKLVNLRLTGWRSIHVLLEMMYLHCTKGSEKFTSFKIRSDRFNIIFPRSYYNGKELDSDKRQNKVENLDEFHY